MSEPAGGPPQQGTPPTVPVSNPPVQTAPVGVTPPVTPPTPPPPAEPPTSDEDIKMSQEALTKRLEREREKANEELLKSYGFNSREELGEWKKTQDESIAAKAEEERQKLSEIERYKADVAARDKELADEKAARAVAQQEAEAARVEAHLHSVFAGKGITNSSYALFRVGEKVDSLKDGEELDENAFLEELIKDPREAIALGVAPVDGAPPLQVPATTTTPKTGPQPKQPGPAPAKHASDMSDEEWNAFKKQHGLG